jgi:hypothetical protein
MKLIGLLYLKETGHGMKSETELILETTAKRNISRLCLKWNPDFSVTYPHPNQERISVPYTRQHRRRIFIYIIERILESFSILDTWKLRSGQHGNGLDCTSL